MNWREMVFMLGFAASPAAIWFLRMDPLLDRYTEAIEGQINAQLEETANLKYVYERDQLEDDWASFRPLAQAEMHSLGSALNPIVLQNAALDLARRLDCEFRIEDRTPDEENAVPTFSFAGSGRPLQVSDMLTHLERGQFRARFKDVSVAYSEGRLPGEFEAYFSGSFTIPSLPELDHSVEADELEENWNDNAPEAEVKP